MLFELFQAKYLLHFEAAFFPSLYDLLNLKKQIFERSSADPSTSHNLFDEIATVIPNLCNVISINETQTLFSLRIQELIEFFEKTEDYNRSHDFDEVMLNLFSNFHLSDGVLEIPFSKFPDIETIQSLTSHRNNHVKLLGQLLIVCHLCKEDISIVKENISIAKMLLKTLDEHDATSSQDPLFKYTHQMDFIPLLFSIYEEKNNLRKQNLSLEQLLFQPASCAHIINSASGTWKQQASDFYGLIVHVEKIVKRCLSPSLNDRIDLFEKRSHEKRILDILERSESAYVGSWSLPERNQAGYCVSSTGFYDLLGGLSFNVDNIRAIRSRATSELSQEKVTKPKKQPKIISSSPKISISPVSISTSLSPLSDAQAIPDSIKPAASKTIEQEETPPSVAQNECLHHEEPVIDALEEPTDSSLSAPWTTVRSHKKLSDIETVQQTPCEKLSSVIMETLHKTLLRNTSEISIHPRVSCWFNSTAEGLSYRHFGLQSEHIGEEDMILRHKFPQAILAVARNTVYSKKTTSFKYPNVSTYKSILFIDGKKHILEASINERSSLFHLYAKPVRNLHDYFDNIGELYPSHSTSAHATENPTSSKIDLSAIRILANGNLWFDFEDKSYELVNLALA